MELKLKTFAALFVFILVLLPTSSSGIPTSSTVNRHRRSQTKLCSEVLPCQWGVYGKNPKKQIQFFIENPNCLCGSERKCELAEENLSMAAFIYRCVYEATTSTTTEISETT